MFVACVSFLLQLKSKVKYLLTSVEHNQMQVHVPNRISMGMGDMNRMENSKESVK